MGPFCVFYVPDDDLTVPKPLQNTFYPIKSNGKPITRPRLGIFPYIMSFVYVVNQNRKL